MFHPLSGRFDTDNFETKRFMKSGSGTGTIKPGPTNGPHPQGQGKIGLKLPFRAVNQGLCFFNPELNTYYLKSRKVCLPGQTPKELIIMDLERPQDRLGYTHVEFYITGTRSDLLYHLRLFNMAILLSLGIKLVVSEGDHTSLRKTNDSTKSVVPVSVVQ